MNITTIINTNNIEQHRTQKFQVPLLQTLNKTIPFFRDLPIKVEFHVNDLRIFQLHQILNLR